MRVLSRIGKIIGVFIVALAGLVLAAILVTQTGWFKNWLRGYIVREANLVLNGELSIERLTGNLFSGVELGNVRLTMDGQEVVSIKEVGAKYKIADLVSKAISIRSIRLDGPVVRLERDPQTNEWTIGRIVKKQQTEANRSGPGRPITIEDIGISAGAVLFGSPIGPDAVKVPRRFDRIDASFNFKYEPVRYSIDLEHLSFRGSDPALELNSLSGGIAVRNEEIYFSKLAVRTAETSMLIEGALQNYVSKPALNMKVSSDKFSLEEIGRIVPAVARVDMQPAFELLLDGPFDRLGFGLNLRSSAGDVNGRVVADLITPGQSVDGTINVRHLNLAGLTRLKDLPSDLTADIRADLKGPSLGDLNKLAGQVQIASPRVAAFGFVGDDVRATAGFKQGVLAVRGTARAYGSPTKVEGRITLPQKGRPVTYDLTGTAQHVNAARLPRTLKAPPAQTDVNSAFHVVGVAGGDVRADLQFYDSYVAGARIASGSTATFTVSSTKPGGPSNLGYQGDVNVFGLDLERLGRAFAIPALQTERYKTGLNAHVQGSGAGTTLSTMNGTFSGMLSDSTLMGGRIPQMSFDANVADDSAQVKVNGGFDSFDPGVLSGRPALKGNVGGTLDLTAAIANLSYGFTPEQLDGDIKLSLQPSSEVGGIRLDKADIDARYHNQILEVQTLDIKGLDLSVQASGTVGVAPDSESKLTFHADSSNLPELGKLIDRPLTGIAKIDGTITGTRANLKAEGNFVGDGISYGSNSALTLSTNYTVTIPNLSFNDVVVDARTEGTFVAVGGQRINQLTATTRYGNKQLDLTVTATDAPRSMSATGSIFFRTDEQELRLTRLELSAGNLRWQLAAPDGANIKYGGGATTVQNFDLVSGTQRISANGTFGRADDQLMFAVTDLDVRNIDALLLRPPQFSGTLNASGSVSKKDDAPQVTAEFQIDQGGFRDFRYNSLKGSVGYNGRGATIDARLDQSPMASVRVNGYAPSSLWGSGSPDDRVQLHVESSPIDLGIVQGFTTSVTNVKGTTQATIDVTGTGAAPQVAGTWVVTDASFLAAPTGVGYAHINGKVELQNDRAHIVSFTVLDQHDNFMSLTGDVPLRRGLSNDVQLQITARDFKVLDNELGDGRLDTDLGVTGDIRAPKIEGDIYVLSGTIKLDPLLAKTTGSAYATKPTDFQTATPIDLSAGAGTGPAGAQQPTEPPRQAGFDAAQLDIRVNIDNDLIVKSNDLKTPNSPIGLGAVNITLGGDVRVLKDAGEKMRIDGEVTTVRGTYDFQGRRFTILRDGMVRFEGEDIDHLNPTLNVKTQRTIQGVVANVNILGTMQRPRIELSSSPPMDQGDILSLIVFNQPVNQLGEGQQISIGQRAQDLALGSVAGQLSKSLGDVLHLSEFEIQTSPESGAAAQLTVGQQVSRNLYVKLEQGVGNQSGTTNFILEYEFTNWLRMQTNFVQQAAAQQALFQSVKDSGFDLIFSFTK